MSAIPSHPNPPDHPQGTPAASAVGRADDGEEMAAAIKTAAAAEFRPYRRFVTWSALALISLGVGYLLVSVGVTIYRQRHAVVAGEPIDAQLSAKSLAGCWQELSDVRAGLEKHLEKAHYLLGGYDQDEAQRWASEGDIWRSQWRVLGERCRFGQAALAVVPPHFEELSAAWRELGDTAKTYSDELRRFGKEQSPRLHRLRVRIDRIGTRLGSP